MFRIFVSAPLIYPDQLWLEGRSCGCDRTLNLSHQWLISIKEIDNQLRGLKPTVKFAKGCSLNVTISLCNTNLVSTTLLLYRAVFLSCAGCKLFNRKAFLHPYLQEGMEEMEKRPLLTLKILWLNQAYEWSLIMSVCCCTCITNFVRYVSNFCLSPSHSRIRNQHSDQNSSDTNDLSLFLNVPKYLLLWRIK